MISEDGIQVVLPRLLFEAVKQIVLDKCTGNVQLNFKDGRLLGFRAERVVSLR